MGVYTKDVGTKEHKGLLLSVMGRIVYILIVGIKASFLFLLKCSSTEPLTGLFSLPFPHHY